MRPKPVPLGSVWRYSPKVGMNHIEVCLLKLANVVVDSSSDGKWTVDISKMTF